MPCTEVPKWKQMKCKNFGSCRIKPQNCGRWWNICGNLDSELASNGLGYGWCYWIDAGPFTTTFCKVPIYKDVDMTKRCLLISVWKKLYAPIDVAISKPK